MAYIIPEPPKPEPEFEVRCTNSMCAKLVAYTRADVRVSDDVPWEPSVDFVHCPACGHVIWLSAGRTPRVTPAS